MTRLTAEQMAEIRARDALPRDETKSMASCCENGAEVADAVVEQMLDDRRALLAHVEAVEGELHRAFSVLELYGVPHERARNVANGIEVLVTRMDRETRALEADLAACRRERDLYRDPIYDGYAVFSALSEQAKRRTGPENVSDVLDALAAVCRARRDAALSTQAAGEQIPGAHIQE